MPPSDPEFAESALRFGLTGQVVVVTGGGSGIGRSTALWAGRDGAAVAVLDVNDEGLDETVAQLDSVGGKARAYHVDVTDADALDRVVGQIEADLGPVYGLVPCAGTSRPEPAATMPLETWSMLVELNLTGLFRTCQAVGRRLLAHGRGSIVTIGSVDSFGGHAGRAHYCATKYAVANLTRALAIEWGARGVRVNCLAPGIVDTPLIRRGIPIDQLENVLLERTPHPRYAGGDDMAKAAMFLLSDAASYVNGAVLSADGGLSAGRLTSVSLTSGSARHG